MQTVFEATVWDISKKHKQPFSLHSFSHPELTLQGANLKMVDT